MVELQGIRYQAFVVCVAMIFLLSNCLANKSKVYYHSINSGAEGRSLGKPRVGGHLL